MQLLEILVFLFAFSEFAVGIYRRSSLDERQLCSSNLVDQFTRKFFQQSRELYVSRDNALIISHVWRSEKSLRHFVEECTFVVESKSHTGLILNINQLYFRHNNLILRECYDYVKLQFSNGTKTEKLCGLVSPNNGTGIVSYVDPGGRMKVKIKIEDDIRLNPGESLHIEMVFTQFEECQHANHFPCDEGRCISQKFVRDSVINCPKPNCLDEQGCQNTSSVTQVPSSYTSKRAIIGGIASSLVLIVGLSICTCILCRYCKCARARNHNSRRNRRNNNNSNSGNNQNGGNSRGEGGRSRSRRPTDLPIAPTAPQPQPPQQPVDIIIPTAPPNTEQHKDSPPPTYESLFG